MSRYQHVVSPDGPADSLQSVSDFASVPRVFFPEFQHSHGAFKKHLKTPGIRFGLDALHHAILEDHTPNLYVLHYDLTRWAVQTVILIPHFAFALSAVERRKPLAATALRAGWVGCNIVLDKIPVHARIPVIEEGNVRSKQAVREAYQRLRPLEKLQVEKRGWTLDVLQVVQSLDKKEFLLSDVYAHADALAKLHPANRHIQPKIRQQLQVLRDLGLVEFLGSGRYRLR